MMTKEHGWTSCKDEGSYQVRLGVEGMAHRAPADGVAAAVGVGLNEKLRYASGRTLAQTLVPDADAAA